MKVWNIIALIEYGSGVLFRKFCSSIRKSDIVGTMLIPEHLKFNVDASKGFSNHFVTYISSLLSTIWEIIKIDLLEY